MLDGIDALVALETFGTVSEAATRLRLTQSAVSKRLRVLEAELGVRLVERDGRRLRLTVRALDFLEGARPLVRELRGLIHRRTADVLPSFSLALADSIASSWGPAVVRRALDEVPAVTIDLHAHRSVLVVESVRLGRYDAGLCTETPAVRDLVTHPVVVEPMTLVGCAFESPLTRGAPLITIEETSATFRAIQPALRAHHPELLGRRPVFVESFGAVVRMTRAGFGNGLVPLGLALDLRVPRKARRTLGRVARSIVLITRKSLQEAGTFVGFRDQLVKAATRHFATAASHRDASDSS